MERGNVVKPRTVTLPAVGDDPYELQEAARIEYVSIMISYASPIMWVFAKDNAEALDLFGKGLYFIYRGSDTQFEIPCRGEQPFFYVRRVSAGVALPAGLSVALVQGAER